MLNFKMLPDTDCGLDNQLLNTEIHFILKKTKKDPIPLWYNLELEIHKICVRTRFKDLDLVNRKFKELQEEVKMFKEEDENHITRIKETENATL